MKKILFASLSLIAAVVAFVYYLKSCAMFVDKETRYTRFCLREK